MKRRRSNKIMFYNTVPIIGLASVTIIIFLTMYFFDNDNLEYTPMEFGVILNDSSYYSDSNIPGWHNITAGVFEIQTPTDYKIFRLQGFDSYVGGFTNNHDTCFFDYGEHSNSLTGFSQPEYKTIEELINNKIYRIVIGQDQTQYIAAYTEDLNAEKKLMIECPNCNEIQEKHRMIRTIKFKRK